MGCVLVAVLGCCLRPALAQLTVSGVADKQFYADSVTFTIPTQAGFTYAAFLNTNPVPSGVAVTVNRPDFYQLVVTRTETATSAVTNRLVRFIVRDGSREGTETGLPPHTPWPVIQSSPAEFEGARLRLMAPAAFPGGYPVPLIAWVVDANGTAVRANGLLQSPGQPAIQIRRGVGSGFLNSNSPPGTLDYAASVGGLTTNRAVMIEGETAWTPVLSLSGSVTWPAGSRIHVTGPFAIAAGATLTVEAGTIVRINSAITLTNSGSVIINGTPEQPVVFMPTVRTQPWGGFVQHASNTLFSAVGAIFTGSGAEPCWYNGEGCNTNLSGIGSHRGEQALVSLDGGNCNLTLTDCAAIDLAGQLGHSRSGTGKGYQVAITRFLLQRCSTGGEYTSANFTVNDSAFIEFPDDSDHFENGDNDALYIVNGTHFFTNCLFGWTKDDGIDSGGGGFGPLTYQSCWFEATFHEGNSLSGYKNTFARDTVYLDCGQGIEDGYDGPTGRVDHCFFSLCKSGVRHGDNYNDFSGYAGRMTATNSILLWNHRDIFGYNWDDQGGWTNNWGGCFASNNFVTVADTNFPNNTVWNPSNDAWRLASFGARGRAGVGLAVRPGQTTLGSFPDGLPVGLSMACTNEISVNYSIAGTDGTSGGGTLVFPPGRMRHFIPLPLGVTGVVRVALSNPVNADLTGFSELLFQNITASAAPTVLSPLGATWRYLDNGSEQGTAWRASGFNDSAWPAGVARLGFGADAAAATTIRRYVTGTSGPQITNYYFRRAFTVTDPSAFASVQFRYQRDDGCLVYLNGAPIITNNMPPGPITATNFASSTVTPASETQRFWTNTLPASALLPGINVLAAEVHQSTATSSDIAWELQVLGLPLPRLDVTRLEGQPIIYWTDGTFSLEQADQLPAPNWTPAASASPVSIPPAEPFRVYRLRK